MAIEPKPMTEGRRQRRRALPIAFMIVWLTFWASAILVAIWRLGSSALGGEPGAAVMLGVWMVAALFGFWSGARTLKGLLLGEKRLRRPHGNHAWRDGFDNPTTPPDPPED